MLLSQKQNSQTSYFSYLIWWEIIIQFWRWKCFPKDIKGGEGYEKEHTIFERLTKQQGNSFGKSRKKPSEAQVTINRTAP